MSVSSETVAGSDARVFTLEEVNDLVPKLAPVVKRQLARRSAIESLLMKLGRELGLPEGDLSTLEGGAR